MSDNLTALIGTPVNIIWDWQDWRPDTLRLFVLVLLIAGSSMIVLGIIRYIKRRRRRNVQNT